MWPGKLYIHYEEWLHPAHNLKHPFGISRPSLMMNWVTIDIAVSSDRDEATQGLIGRKSGRSERRGPVMNSQFAVVNCTALVYKNRRFLWTLWRGCHVIEESQADIKFFLLAVVGSTLRHTAPTCKKSGEDHARIFYGNFVGRYTNRILHCQHLRANTLLVT